MKNLRIFFRSAAVTALILVIISATMLSAVTADTRYRAALGNDSRSILEYNADHNILYVSVFGETVEIDLRSIDTAYSAASGAIPGVLPYVVLFFDLCSAATDFITDALTG